MNNQTTPSRTNLEDYSKQVITVHTADNSGISLGNAINESLISIVSSPSLSSTSTTTARNTSEKSTTSVIDTNLPVHSSPSTTPLHGSGTPPALTNSGNRVRRGSKYKGVSKHNELWKATIVLRHGGFEILGYYDTEEAAARAYDKAVLRSARARVNKIRSWNNRRKRQKQHNGTSTGTTTTEEISALSTSPSQTMSSSSSSSNSSNTMDDPESIAIMNSLRSELNFADTELSDDEHNEECMYCHEGGELLMCDGCPRVWHLHCLYPSLETIPEGEWYCPLCILERGDGTTAVTCPFPNCAQDNIRDKNLLISHYNGKCKHLKKQIELNQVNEYGIPLSVVHTASPSSLSSHNLNHTLAISTSPLTPHNNNSSNVQPSIRSSSPSAHSIDNGGGGGEKNNTNAPNEEKKKYGKRSRNSTSPVVDPSGTAITDGGPSNTSDNEDNNGNNNNDPNNKYTEKGSGSSSNDKKLNWRQKKALKLAAIAAAAASQGTDIAEYLASSKKSKNRLVPNMDHSDSDDTTSNNSVAKSTTNDHPPPHHDDEPFVLDENGNPVVTEPSTTKKRHRKDDNGNDPLFPGLEGDELRKAKVKLRNQKNREKMRLRKQQSQGGLLGDSGLLGFDELDMDDSEGENYLTHPNGSNDKDDPHTAGNHPNITNSSTTSSSSSAGVMGGTVPNRKRRINVPDTADNGTSSLGTSTTISTLNLSSILGQSILNPYQHISLPTVVALANFLHSQALNTQRNTFKFRETALTKLPELFDQDTVLASTLTAVANETSISNLLYILNGTNVSEKRNISSASSSSAFLSNGETGPLGSNVIFDPQVLLIANQIQIPGILYRKTLNGIGWYVKGPLRISRTTDNGGKDIPDNSTVIVARIGRYRTMEEARKAWENLYGPVALAVQTYHQIHGLPYGSSATSNDTENMDDDHGSKFIPNQQTTETTVFHPPLRTLSNPSVSGSVTSLVGMDTGILSATSTTIVPDVSYPTLTTTTTTTIVPAGPSNPSPVPSDGLSSPLSSIPSTPLRTISVSSKLNNLGLTNHTGSTNSLSVMDPSVPRTNTTTTSTVTGNLPPVISSSTFVSSSSSLPRSSPLSRPPIINSFQYMQYHPAFKDIPCTDPALLKWCMTCKDDELFYRLCEDCGCQVCFDRTGPRNSINCSVYGCVSEVHYRCLSDYLPKPNQLWFCEDCIHDGYGNNNSSSSSTKGHPQHTHQSSLPMNNRTSTNPHPTTNNTDIGRPSPITTPQRNFSVSNNASLYPLLSSHTILSPSVVLSYPSPSKLTVPSATASRLLILLITCLTGNVQSLQSLLLLGYPSITDHGGNTGQSTKNGQTTNDDGLASLPFSNPAHILLRLPWRTQKLIASILNIAIASCRRRQYNHIHNLSNTGNNHGSVPLSYPASVTIPGSNNNSSSTVTNNVNTSSMGRVPSYPNLGSIQNNFQRTQSTGNLNTSSSNNNIKDMIYTPLSNESEVPSLASSPMVVDATSSANRTVTAAATIFEQQQQQENVPKRTLSTTVPTGIPSTIPPPPSSEPLKFTVDIRYTEELLIKAFSQAFRSKGLLATSGIGSNVTDTNTVNNHTVIDSSSNGTVLTNTTNGLTIPAVQHHPLIVGNTPYRTGISNSSTTEPSLTSSSSSIPSSVTITEPFVHLYEGYLHPGGTEKDEDNENGYYSMSGNIYSNSASRRQNSAERISSASVSIPVHALTNGTSLGSNTVGDGGNSNASLTSTSPTKGLVSSSPSSLGFVATGTPSMLRERLDQILHQRPSALTMKQFQALPDHRNKDGNAPSTEKQGGKRSRHQQSNAHTFLPSSTFTGIPPLEGENSSGLIAFKSSPFRTGGATSVSASMAATTSSTLSSSSMIAIDTPLINRNDSTGTTYNGNNTSSTISTTNNPLPLNPTVLSSIAASASTSMYSNLSLIQARLLDEVMNRRRISVLKNWGRSEVILLVQLELLMKEAWERLQHFLNPPSRQGTPVPSVGDTLTHTNTHSTTDNTATNNDENALQQRSKDHQGVPTTTNNNKRVKVTNSGNTDTNENNTEEKLARLVFDTMVKTLQSGSSSYPSIGSDGTLPMSNVGTNSSLLPHQQQLSLLSALATHSASTLPLDTSLYLGLPSLDYLATTIKPSSVTASAVDTSMGVKLFLSYGKERNNPPELSQRIVTKTTEEANHNTLVNGMINSSILPEIEQYNNLSETNYQKAMDIFVQITDPTTLLVPTDIAIIRHALLHASLPQLSLLQRSLTIARTQVWQTVVSAAANSSTTTSSSHAKATNITTTVTTGTTDHSSVSNVPGVGGGGTDGKLHSSTESLAEPSVPNLHIHASSYPSVGREVSDTELLSNEHNYNNGGGNNNNTNEWDTEQQLQQETAKKLAESRKRLAKLRQGAQEVTTPLAIMLSTRQRSFISSSLSSSVAGEITFFPHENSSSSSSSSSSSVPNLTGLEHAVLTDLITGPGNNNTSNHHHNDGSDSNTNAHHGTHSIPSDVVGSFANNSSGSSHGNENGNNNGNHLPPMGSSSSLIIPPVDMELEF